jgi:hypothetical protein
MSRRILTILLALSALPAMASSAFAAPITTTTSRSLSLDTAGVATTTLLLDMFDAGLGTLTGVEVTIGDPLMATLLTTFQSVGAPGSIDATLWFSIEGLPLVAPTSLDLATMAFSCVSCPAADTESNPWTFRFGYDPTIVAPFIGSGTLPLTLKALVTGSAQNAVATGSLSGSVDVAYTYEPGPATTPVPEPASLLLLACGIAATALGRGQGGIRTRTRPIVASSLPGAPRAWLR